MPGFFQGHRTATLEGRQTQVNLHNPSSSLSGRRSARWRRNVQAAKVAQMPGAAGSMAEVACFLPLVFVCSGFPLKSTTKTTSSMGSWGLGTPRREHVFLFCLWASSNIVGTRRHVETPCISAPFPAMRILALQDLSLV